MKTIRVLAPMLGLSMALLVGCSQGAPAGSAPATGSAPAAVEEKAPEPAMSNWTEVSFYERPVAEVVADLELLSFEVSDPEYFEGEPGYTYFTFSCFGKPEDVPLPDVSETVQIAFTVEQPQFTDDADEKTLDMLAEGTMTTSVDLIMYHADVDPSEYEGLANQAVEALGLNPISEGSTEPSPFDETRMLGYYSGPITAMGTETEYGIMVLSSPDSAVDPDMPLIIDIALFYLSPAA